jgi:hypothetical protein
MFDFFADCIMFPRVIFSISNLLGKPASDCENKQHAGGTRIAASNLMVPVSVAG